METSVLVFSNLATFFGAVGAVLPALRRRLFAATGLPPHRLSNPRGVSMKTGARPLWLAACAGGCA